MKTAVLATAVQNKENIKLTCRVLLGRLVAEPAFFSTDELFTEMELELQGRARHVAAQRPTLQRPTVRGIFHSPNTVGLQI